MLRRHCRTILCVSLLLAAGQAQAAPRWDPLDGRWTGPGMSIRFDSERAQANRDPKKPFAWEPYRVRNIAGPMVVFTIGPGLFFAHVADDVLTLTSPTFQGARTLTRATPRAAPGG